MRDISFWRVFLPLLLILFPFPGTSTQGKKFAVDLRKVIDIDWYPFLPVDREGILLSKCYQFTRFLLQKGPTQQHIVQGVTQEIGNSSTTCRFNFDPYNVKVDVKVAANYEDTVWTCALDNHNVCDGLSQCLTDECSCKITLLKYSTALTAQAASRSTIYVMVPGTVLMGLMSATVKMLSRFLAR